MITFFYPSDFRYSFYTKPIAIYKQLQLLTKELVSGTVKQKFILERYITGTLVLSANLRIF